MKIPKRISAMLLCAILCFTVSISSFAATDTAAIKVSSTEALPGDAVTITIDISNNPGIMAMAFCITYDSDALVYKNYSKGYLSSYTVKDHSDKGYVSFVNVENKDISTDGTIISVLFEVKEDAAPGKHVITLANSNIDRHGKKLHNSFSNSKQQFIVPSVVSGGVTVAETCNNAGHKYSEWNIVYPATCTNTGLRNRLCERCSTFSEEIIPIAHDFEADWTVDKAATPEEDGIMSRHCTKCDAVTDEITFSYEEIGGSEDDTSSDSDSDNTSSDNDSSSEITSTESNTTESSSSGDTIDDSASSTSSQTTPTQKPIINNVVGEKVPLSEVEKFEDYQQSIKSDTDNNADDSSNTDNDTSSVVIPDSSDATTNTIENNNSTVVNKEPSFFSTTGGIITIVLCSVLSIGILALGVLLILRNKKTND